MNKMRLQTRMKWRLVLLATVALMLWVGVPLLSWLMGQRPLWHEARVLTVGSLLGFVSFQAMEWAVQRYRQRKSL